MKAIQPAIVAHNCSGHNICLIYDDGIQLTSRHQVLYGYTLAAAAAGGDTNDQALIVNVPNKVCILQHMSVLYSIMDNERESLCHFTTNANILEHHPPENTNVMD